MRNTIIVNPLIP